MRHPAVIVHVVEMVWIRHGADVLGIQGAALQTLVFGLLENEVFDFTGVFDMSKLQLRMGDVAGVTDDGAQTHDALEEAGGQGYVLNFIHVAVVFLAVQEAFINGDDFFGNGISGKGKGQP